MATINRDWHECHRLGRRASLDEPKQIVRAGYDAVSHAYRPAAGALPGPDYAAWVDLLFEHVGPCRRILDLGCGCGVPAAQLLAARGAEVTGVDMSPVQIERARALLPACRFVCGDMCSAEFPPGSFDAVVSFYSIIHVPLDEQPALFGRIAAWLAPGGGFLGTLGNAAWTGTEPDWLGVRGATMYWSHADAATYRRWIGAAGFEILREEFVPEGSGGHQLFLARLTAPPQGPARRAC